MKCKYLKIFNVTYLKSSANVHLEFSEKTLEVQLYVVQFI